MKPTTAYIALGSNLGDRAQHLGQAIELLRLTPGIEIGRVSSYLDNPAIGGDDDSPAFLNAAVEVRTSLSALNLLHKLLEIELQMGRQRRRKWEPRLIDLDLLLYGQEIHSSMELMVPHPLMHERRFVLQPLAEIAPQAVHPGLLMTAEGLLEALSKKPG